jgi:hypothetical protein
MTSSGSVFGRSRGTQQRPVLVQKKSWVRNRIRSPTCLFEDSMSARLDYRKRPATNFFPPRDLDDGRHDRRVEQLGLLSRVIGLRGLYENAREAFEGMLEEMTTEVSPGRYKRFTLSEKQEAWVRRCLGEEVVQPDNRFSRGAIPRGRHVPTPEVLKNLPKFPPGRKVESREEHSWRLNAVRHAIATDRRSFVPDVLKNLPKFPPGRRPT